MVKKDREVNMGFRSPYYYNYYYRDEERSPEASLHQ